VLWGAVFLAAFAVTPSDAFLTLYILSALNAAGSAGDLYQAARTTQLPVTALIWDDDRTNHSAGTPLLISAEQLTPDRDVGRDYERRIPPATADGRGVD
jgi:hypothetical protein